MALSDDTEAVVMAALAPFMVWRSARMLRDEARLREYIETAPKARWFRGKFGVERSIELTRRYFLPIGIAMWVIVGALGGYLLLLKIR